MDERFTACGVISVTTDFGHKGPFVGTMKGRMLARFPQARIVDLTHETLVHWPDEAGFWLSRSYGYFPTGTVHVAVVDPGVGTGRDIIALQRDGHLFIAPDNGLLAPLADGARVWRLDDARLERFGVHDPSPTFHGRDIFAPVAAALAAGGAQPRELGPAVTSVVPAWLDPPVVSAAGVRGVVVTADNFGNLITNIDAHLLDGLRHPAAQVAGREIPLRQTYGDVGPGDYLALINSFGVLEIACAERSAEERLGVGRGAPVAVREAGEA